MDMKQLGYLLFMQEQEDKAKQSKEVNVDSDNLLVDEESTTSQEDE